MKFNVQDTIKRAEQEYGLGKGQYFKAQEGANKIRLLSPAIFYQSTYNGNPTSRFVAWILDRRDGQVKLYFMPMTIMNAIGGLQMSDDFGFDEVPMPYDVTIMAKGAGTKEVEYTVVGARQNTPLTPEELKEFQEKPSIDEVIKKLKEKQPSDGALQEQPQSSDEKAQTVDAGLIGGNEPITAQSERIEPPVDDEVRVEDIPF